MGDRFIAGGIGFDCEKIAAHETKHAKELAFGAVTIPADRADGADLLDAVRMAVEEVGLLVFEHDDSPHGDGERADQGIFNPALGLKFLSKAKQAGAKERRIVIGNGGESGAETMFLFRVLRDARFAGGGARSRASLCIAAIGGDLCGCGHD